MPSSGRPAAAVPLLGLALLLAGCTSTVAGAGTPAAAPEDPPSERQMTRGAWLLEYTTSVSGYEEFELDFDADGGFSYPHDNNSDPETWSIDGVDISMCFNDCYSEYQGSWVGDRFEGTAENVTGLTWNWTMTRT